MNKESERIHTRKLEDRIKVLEEALKELWFWTEAKEDFPHLNTGSFTEGYKNAMVLTFEALGEREKKEKL